MSRDPRTLRQGITRGGPTGPATVAVIRLDAKRGTGSPILMTIRLEVDVMVDQLDREDIAREEQGP